MILQPAENAFKSMNWRTIRIVPTALLGVASLLYSQDSLPSSSSVGDGQQQANPNASALCPDGSMPTFSLGGEETCGSNRQSFSTGSGTGINSPKSISGSSVEDTSVAGGVRRQVQRISPPEPLTEFQKFVAATTGELLPIYGSNLFRTVPSTFAPSDLLPASSEYILGTDDELRLRIWGQVNYSGNLRIDRSGNIFVPEVGVIHVAGLRFSDLDAHLRQALGKIYRNFDLTVDVGRIRSIQVYIAGRARHPGAYTISSLSSLVDALFASGGPSAEGSLRHIELRRSGKTVADFDMYDLLVRGDKSQDARLEPEDVIFIPPVGPQVAIAGSVSSPGIFEMRTSETVGQVLEMAGRTTAIASSSRISIERLGDHQDRQSMEVGLDTAGISTMVKDGDILRVYPIKAAYRNTITLRGNVANPGRFGWHEGMRLSDLIPDKDSLLSRDYWWKRSHLGLPSPEFEPYMSRLDPNQQKTVRTTVIPGSNSVDGRQADSGDNSSSGSPSGPYQIVRQYTVNPDPSQPYQELTGAAAQELLSSGLNAEAHPQSQNDSYDYSTEQTNRNTSGTAGNLGIAGSDGRDNSQSAGTANGRTNKTDVRVTSAQIYWSYAVVERVDSETLKTHLIPFDLGKLVINHDSSQNLLLQPGDTVTIFSQSDIRVPIEEQTKYVRLEGEFAHAGVYSVMPGETLKHLVERAGGLTSKAYLYGSEFDRESTRVLQQHRIDEYVQRVDLDAGRGTLAVTASATTSTGGAANSAAATAAERELITRLKQLRATGRIVLNFSNANVTADEIPDISLENGDRFVIPPVPATINIVGAVYDQNSFVYRAGGSVGRYLTLAGGHDRDADWRQTFVIRADGSVVGRKTVKGVWGNTFAQMKLNPGDTIIVPDKTLRPTALRGLLDWTQIFSQLAIGAAAVNVLR